MDALGPRAKKFEDQLMVHFAKLKDDSMPDWMSKKSKLGQPAVIDGLGMIVAKDVRNQYADQAMRAATDFLYGSARQV